ncbi:MAG TPA: SAM-dependent methyltransferase [Lachnoclostridium sp.]|jgi:SAM-dependent methyltransferase|uniref:class I SAM-dependent methyltransferase n=1 Tax=Lacrimispora sp. TaxID=2719234 RepID=UPI000EC725A0|nr:methyltransferase domain-containing protein [Lacrimispora sp.]HCD44526.1 SAM-dependent methyltransferase [Lachnoclostridium sp.]
MNDISPELKKLFLKYDGDTKKLLQEHPNLDYLYALSDIRENLLEWYEFDEAGSLLQIGSDYGALTGLYSRRVRQVTVLEPEHNNLSVNRLRNEKQDNIRYITGELDSFEEEGFDYVVMVGSLMPPYDKHIKKAKSLLKPEGKLILSICNRLGLKYQAGAVPDKDRLSRTEVLELLCGEDGQQGKAEFYYPMPDYRLPVTMYSDEYLPGKGDLTHAILAYDYPKYLRFDLGKMFDEVCEGKQFETFANSFLTIWSRYEEN